MNKSIARITSHSLFRYMFIGGLAFASDYALLLALYYVFSLPLAVATTAGFTTGLLVSFMANRYWVFGNKGSERYIGRQGIEYGLLVIFNYLFTVLVVNYLHSRGMPPYVSKILVMLAIICWNYLLFSKFIFRDKPR